MAKHLVVLYHPDDSKSALDLLVQLKPLVDAGEFTLFEPGMTRPGEKTEVVLSDQLRRADVLAFLITATFMAHSPWTTWAQLANDRKIPLVPVLCRAVLWEFGPLKGLTPLPPSGTPVESSKDRAHTWQQVAAGLLQELTPKADAPAPPSTAQRNRVRILHLSDLHERGDREDEAFRRYRVLGDSFESLLAQIKDTAFTQERAAVDLVLFSGDLADWGNPDEYHMATQFVDRVVGLLGLPKSRFFPVPGNHDINRKVEPKAWATLRQELLHPDLSTQQSSRWIAGRPAPRHLHNDLLTAVLRRRAAYDDWVFDGLGRAELLPSASPHGRLGYRATVDLPGRPFPIQIVGLDSAWLAGDDNDAGKLLLTEDQVARLVLGKDGRPLPGLRIALCHHPLSDLYDRQDVAKYLTTKNVDLLLRGHLHQGEIATATTPDQKTYQLAAGCLYEGHLANKYRNACHAIDVVTDETGRPLQFEIQLFGYSDQGDGFWHHDPTLYRAAHQGKLVWQAAQPKK